MLYSIFFILLSVIDPKYINGFVSNFGFTANKYEFKKRKHNAWLDNTVTAKIPASLESTWELFTDLEKHPIWSPWLDEVQYHSNQKKFEGIFELLEVQILKSSQRRSKDGAKTAQRQRKD